VAFAGLGQYLLTRVAAEVRVDVVAGGPFRVQHLSGQVKEITRQHEGFAAIGHDHRPILVLADLLGGTPFNVASAIARRSPRLVCVAGVNLAMVVEAALSVGALDDALVERLIEVGRSGIVETERHRARRVS